MMPASRPPMSILVSPHKGSPGNFTPYLNATVSRLDRREPQGLMSGFFSAQLLSETISVKSFITQKNIKLPSGGTGGVCKRLKAVCFIQMHDVM